MTRALPLLALAALLGGLTAARAQGENPSFNLVNRGASPVRELYVTPAGDARWGRNRLDRITIAPGGSFPVRRRVDGNCVFDIRAVFTDGHTEDRRGLNTCTVEDVFVGQPTSPASEGAAAGRKAPDDPSFRLVNRSKQAIVEAFATPAGLGNWGENRLGTGPLAPSGDRPISVPRQGTCVFDLRVVFADKSAKERRKTNLCRATEVPVS